MIVMKYINMEGIYLGFIYFEHVIKYSPKPVVWRVAGRSSSLVANLRIPLTIFQGDGKNMSVDLEIQVCNNKVNFE